MGYDYVLFDLDGTLTDPAEGTTNSVMYALKKFGIDVTDRRELFRFIGPPLVDSFEEFYGFSRVTALAAVAYYREYYSAGGIFECTLYDGIPELLNDLNSVGTKAVVATSKPEHFAAELMRHFNIDRCFSAICGATMDNKRSNKEDVIAYALNTAGIVDRRKCVMIGDRKFDINGAKAFGLDSIGVTYGYGTASEIAEHSPTYIAQSVAQLREILIPR